MNATFASDLNCDRKLDESGCIPDPVGAKQIAEGHNANLFVTKHLPTALGCHLPITRHNLAYFNYGAENFARAFLGVGTGTTDTWKQRNNSFSFSYFITPWKSMLPQAADAEGRLKCPKPTLMANIVGRPPAS